MTTSTTTVKSTTRTINNDGSPRKVRTTGLQKAIESATFELAGAHRSELRAVMARERALTEIAALDARIQHFTTLVNMLGQTLKVLESTKVTVTVTG